MATKALSLYRHAGYRSFTFDAVPEAQASTWGFRAAYVVGSRLGTPLTAVIGPRQRYDHLADEMTYAGTVPVYTSKEEALAVSAEYVEALETHSFIGWWLDNNRPRRSDGGFAPVDRAMAMAAFQAFKRRGA